ncbi:MAG: lysophospholipid acyltransferase family protein [Microbacteriaceae bacterium]
MTPPRWERDRAWRVFAFFALPVLSATVKLRFHDGHKLPSTGAFILAPNHYSNFDPVVVGLSMYKLGRVPRFLAKASLFRIPVFGKLIMHGLGHIPVERSGRGANPLAAVSDISERGLAVLIYPEGSLTRDPDLWPMRGKTGAVRAALENGVPIIPAAHWGTQAIMPRYSKKPSIFPRKTVDVIIGDPVDLSQWQDRPRDAATLAEATDAVMAAITGLVEQLRNETAPPVRWNPAEHGQTEFGRPDGS